MGLSIMNYTYSYGMLQKIRNVIAEHEGKDLQKIYDETETTKYHNLINHNDCEGGYISFSTFGIDQLPKNLEDLYRWGDLDMLKKEVEELKEVLKPEMEKIGVVHAWIDFCTDVEWTDEVLLFN